MGDALLPSYDMIVVGAGPAGSTAAKLAADRGWRTLLVDKARFPRHKTCASWINRLAFERFPYLKPHMERLVDGPFFGIRFWDAALKRKAEYAEATPSGYLTLRRKFDFGLKEIAVAAGAEFLEGNGIAELDQDDRGVSIRLEDGEEFHGRVLIGADGANSKVAVLAGMRQGWSEKESVLCANEDVPYAPEKVREFYGSPDLGPRWPILVALQFDGLTGYGWVFPKPAPPEAFAPMDRGKGESGPAHICVGIGGRVPRGERIQDWYRRFLEACRRAGLVPDDLTSQEVHFAIDPAGAVNKGGSLVRGRVMLVGDAAGFVSGTTGEGIYPAMESARVAVEVVAKALRGKDSSGELAQYQTAWRPALASYLRDLPGDQKRRSTLHRIEWIFRSPLVARAAGRIFLYGESTARGLWRSLFA